MDTILLVIVLLIPLIWFSAERIQTKRKIIEGSDEYWGMVIKAPTDNRASSPERTEHNQSAQKQSFEHSGKLYYSIPGRSFTAYISNGRMLKRR